MKEVIRQFLDFCVVISVKLTYCSMLASASFCSVSFANPRRRNFGRVYMFEMSPVPSLVAYEASSLVAEWTIAIVGI